MSILPELVVGGTAAVGVFICAVKRLSALDVEMRTNRERERARYLLARQRREEIQTRISTTTSYKTFTRCQLKEALRQLDQHTVRAPSAPFDLSTPLQTEALSARLFEMSGHKPDAAELAHELGHLEITEGWAARRFAMAQRLNPTRRRVRAEMPVWALALLDPEDAERCAGEWAAHLHERIQDGEPRAARSDRRGFVRYAVLLAIARRTRRATTDTQQQRARSAHDIGRCRGE